MPGGAEQVRAACLVFDDEGDVEAPECDRAVDVEEISCQERACVGRAGTRTSIRRAAMAAGCGGRGDLADGGGGYAMAEPA
jgi:hypothetical protein